MLAIRRNNTDPFSLLDPFAIFDSCSPQHFGTKITDEGKLEIFVEIPGVKKENLSLITEGRNIKLTAQRHDHKKIERSWVVSDAYDLNTAEARLEDGILTITVSPNSSQAKREIEIKTLC